MAEHGKVGPEHARRTAEMKLLSEGAASHHISVRRVETGPGHRLYLAVPKGEAPADGWPVLYLLDGNAAFDFLTAEMLAAVPGLMLVGVGYDTDKQFSRERRTLDFTPPEGPGDGIRPDHVHEGRMAGGALQFLDRLTGPLRIAAEEGLRVDPARRILWGHSFGGLFTLYAALTWPGEFARYAVISPSIWWDEALIRRIAAAARPLDPAPPMLMALGDKEKRSGSDGPPPDGPAPATMDFIQGLAQHPGYRARIHVLKDHVHIQTIAGSLPLALAFAAEA
ncbi:alpha/beta hydrolase [Pseudogemmobacter faecipullorum]|uniref:Alpha/beta hydrolase n=1 Tax=Pseudogemmobacter faecipullorum TaxID=2755041 RepID=A0ABS8CLD3_9RHOB|nr:alpha/beta hydrolase-fold protein [Pseudogemmobacter faecipullorum]MCB5410185.1 alpha/beta hydrolase [Pseudogemmobacter faecipullorum]